MKYKLKPLKPVKPLKQIEVDKRVYNIIRSFVESSEKEKYEWNQGIDYGDHIIFEKSGKWTLTIFKEVETKDPNSAEFMAILEADGGVIAGIMLKSNGMTLYIAGGYEFPVDEEVARTTAIISNVPFAYPIRLLSILSKFFSYFDFEASN